MFCQNYIDPNKVFNIRKNKILNPFEHVKPSNQKRLY